MMSGYTIRENKFENCTNGIFVNGGRNTSIVSNTCDGCYTMVLVEDVGGNDPPECANELRGLDSLIRENPQWNKTFPALQRMAADHACTHMFAYIHGNRCKRSGAGGFSRPDANDTSWATWLSSVGNNSCHVGGGLERAGFKTDDGGTLVEVSRMGAALFGAEGVTLRVAASGALELIDTGGKISTISSSFSEPGPVWNNFSTRAGGWHVAVNHSAAAAGRWLVRAIAVGGGFEVQRTIALDPPPARPASSHSFERHDHFADDRWSFHDRSLCSASGDCCGGAR
jgi:hypothetical protein